MTEYFTPPPFDEIGSSDDQKEDESQQEPESAEQPAEHGGLTPETPPDNLSQFQYIAEKAAPKKRGNANLFEGIDLEQDGEEKRERLSDPADFSSTQFMEEETMLTNIEDYARRIRESSDGYAAKVRKEAEMIRSEVELELAEAVIKRKEADEQAQLIIQSAQNAKNQAIEEGQQQGFEAGYTEGAHQFAQENQQMGQRVHSLIQEFETFQKQLLQQFERQVVDLSLLIAQKVTHQVLREKEDFVLQLLRESLHNFEGQGNIRIRIHPEEFQFLITYQEELSAYLDDEQALKLKPDPSVNPASAMIESEFSSIDLDLNKQFDSIRTKLQECVEERKAAFIR